MAAKTSGDSTWRVSDNIFNRIQDSFTSQGFVKYPSPRLRLSLPGEPLGLGLKPYLDRRVKLIWRSDPMPYALFSNDAKLSRAYPTEADVWKLARRSGLVVDAVSEEEKHAPRPVLDNDYEIKPCRPDPQEDPARNQAEAEAEARLEFKLQP
jgi:hypothetical protein